MICVYSNIGDILSDKLLCVDSNIGDIPQSKLSWRAQATYQSLYVMVETLIPRR